MFVCLQFQATDSNEGWKHEKKIHFGSGFEIGLKITQKISPYFSYISVGRHFSQMYFLRNGGGG